MSAASKLPPISASDVTDAWCSAVREAKARREGCAIRAGEGNIIEVQLINTGAWQELMLPGNGVRFFTADDRDIVLRKITEGK
jgi:DNA-binding sugar fermentation-stimulating protein